jgi:hypothetical protein
MTPSPNALVLGFPHVTERLLDTFNVQFDHAAAAAASAAAAAVSLGLEYACSVVRVGIGCLFAADMAAGQPGQTWQLGSSFWYISSSSDMAFTDCQQQPAADPATTDSVYATVATGLPCSVLCSQNPAVS